MFERMRQPVPKQFQEARMPCFHIRTGIAYSEPDALKRGSQRGAAKPKKSRGVRVEEYGVKQ